MNPDTAPDTAKVQEITLSYTFFEKNVEPGRAGLATSEGGGAGR